MCMFVTNYYLACGHAESRFVSCAGGVLYAANLSDKYCTSSRSSTNYSNGNCEACTLHHGLETLCLSDTVDPLIWMNNVYQASIAADKLEPRDQAIEDNLDMAVGADERRKVPRKRGLEDKRYCRTYNRTKPVACQVPFDIFKQEKKPCTGRGTDGRQAARGNVRRDQATETP